MDASSSSSMSTPAKHDVFLSFRGEGSHVKFTSDLHARLIQKNIKTYIGNRLPKGDEISTVLIKEIRGSRISVIVFSENYASSSWCLDEVVCILKCKKELGQIVVPVFYEIDPSHVRKQQKSYEAAFAKHEERFKENKDKVDDWRSALLEVANISGWDLKSYNGAESEFVEAIAKDILEKLQGIYSLSSDEFKGLVGINKSIEEVEQLLCVDDSATVRFIGIWGMGGLGKTTLAHVLFKRLSSKFQGCCFLANVREVSEHDGFESLKRELFSQLLGEMDPDSSFARQKLRRRKVLIVLDDVNDPQQLEILAAGHDWFGLGSRIIVTTRDASVLRGGAADYLYELKGLASDDALQLFKLNAFNRNYTPTSDDIDVKLFKKVLKYANGIPLVLQVLGSFLRSRRKENWETELKKLNEFPYQSIHRVLRISFDGLDRTEKEVFLDIVCFFKSEWTSSLCRKFVERRLGAHRQFLEEVMNVLIDKALITVKDSNNLVIHDLVMEMGEEIVRQEFIGEPGKCSRLWSDKEIYHVLEKRTGTQKIEGISCGINKGDLSPTVFKPMKRLWLLDVSRSRLQFCEGVQYLPDSLKCLLWNYWPCKSLPSNFRPHNLVELRMPYSSLEQLWSGIQDLRNLKYVDLSFSESLTEISTLSQAPNLVSVNLTGCGSLCKVPSLRFQIRDQISWDQSHYKCNNDECQILGHLKLDFCINLKVVEKISGNLKELHLSFTSVAELPASIWSLHDLVYLNLSGCESLKSVLNDIQKLTSLKHLDLGGCSSLDNLSNEIGCLSQLEKISLDGNNIVEIPVSIKNLSKLIELSICSCKRLQSLPKLPMSLERIDASGCILLQTLSNSRDALIQGLSDNHVMIHGKFFYADCLKPDQNTRNNIVSEFQLRTLYTSIKSVLPHGVLKKSDYPGVAVSCPGNAIPMWFTYQSESSSIKVELSPDWQDNFLGFALCAVVAGDISHLNLSCEANFKTNNAKSCEVHWDFNNVDTNYIRFKTLNLFMWYNHLNYHDYLDSVEVSFGFKTKYSRQDKVRACGIHLLYRQAAEELDVTNKLGKSNVVRSSGDVNSDTDEPPVKRNKHFNS